MTDIGLRVGPGASPPPTASACWRALGSGVRLVVTDATRLGAAEAAVREVLDAVDRACSRFRADSELTRANASSGRPVHIGPVLMAAVAAALRAAEATGAACDPTVGSAVRLAGYDRDWVTVPRVGAAVHLTLRSSLGWRDVVLDEKAATLMVPAGVELDLGATGKSFAADLAAQAASEAIGGGALVGVGGDIATAGCAPAGGWRILVAEDSEMSPDSTGEVVALTGGGLATSGTTVRRWTRGTVRLHHIIDPTTGIPAETPWCSVSVAAATCVDAGAAACAAVVLGAAAPAWLARLRLPARLVAENGATTRVGGWPPPEQAS